MCDKGSIRKRLTQDQNYTSSLNKIHHIPILPSAKLHRGQNSAARVIWEAQSTITRLRFRKEIHWLPIADSGNNLIQNSSTVLPQPVECLSAPPPTPHSRHTNFATFSVLNDSISPHLWNNRTFETRLIVSTLYYRPTYKLLLMSYAMSTFSEWRTINLLIDWLMDWMREWMNEWMNVNEWIN